MFKSIFKNIGITFAIAFCIFSATYIFVVLADWTGPTSAPPTMTEIPTFLNVGPIDQTKTGPLSIAGIVRAEGGIIINAGGATRPTCEASIRGMIWHNRTTSDELEYCQKGVDDTYSWKSF